MISKIAVILLALLGVFVLGQLFLPRLISLMSGGQIAAVTAGCNERWLCHLDWSECVNGIQTRDCEELSQCGTTTHRPTISQTCVPPSETYTSPVSQPQSSNTTWDLTLPNLNLTDNQTKALAILVPAFFATLAALITILLRLWL